MKKVSPKAYRCTHCGTEHSVTTNHYGQVYSRCPNGSCVSRRPVINATYRPPMHDCIEDPLLPDPAVSRASEIQLRMHLASRFDVEIRVPIGRATTPNAALEKELCAVKETDHG